MKTKTTRPFANASASAVVSDEALIRSVVNRMFADGDIDLEIDDSEIRKQITDLETKSNERHNRVSDAMGKSIKLGETLVQGLEDVKKEVNDKLAAFDVTTTVRNELSKAGTLDDAKVRQIADELFQKVYAANTAKAAQSGEQQPLPALEKVDKFFVENKQTVPIQRCIDGHFHGMASGPSGAGKTYPIEQMLRKNGRRYVKVSVADGITLSDFLCRQNVRVNEKKGGTETHWTYGFLPFAMLNGLALVLDEIDQCQPEIVSVLNAVLETGVLYIPQTGERIVAVKGFQVFMTCNTLRDATGNYQGFRLNAALLNRVVFIKADYLDAAEEIAILERVGLAKNDARIIVGLFNALRAAYQAGKLTQAPSTRIAVRIARCLLGMNDDGAKCMTPMKLEEAFSFCLLDGLPENEVKEAKACFKQGI